MGNVRGPYYCRPKVNINGVVFSMIDDVRTIKWSGWHDWKVKN